MAGWGLIGTAVALALLAGCSATPKRVTRAGDTRPDMTGASGSEDLRDGTAASEPFIMLAPATRLGNGTTGPFVPSGTYTRLRIVSTNASNTNSSDPSRSYYAYRSRSPVERFFVGKRHSINFTAKVTAGSFVATVPLLTIAHDSTRGEGEVFNRVIRQDAQDFPMFLVRGNSSSDTAAVTLDLRGSDRIESAAAGSALTAVLDATKLVAPTAPLVTTLNKETSKELATAIDGAINKLFAKSVAEQHLVDRSVRRWTPIVVDLHLPRREGHWSALKSGTRGNDPTLRDLDYVRVGQWLIGFEPPRVSAFTQVAVACPTGGANDADCAAALATARTAAGGEVRKNFGDVLNFPVVRNGATGTLGSYLRQLDWWAAGVKALDGTPADVAGVCRSIRDAVAEIGFNDLDAFLAAEAVAASRSVSSKASRSMAASKECHSSLSR